MKFLNVLLACCLLAACGTRGALVLPPGPPPEPLLGHPKLPQKAAATDVSTPASARP